MKKINLIRIGNHIISENSKPLFIAEMSGNHNQSLIRALSIVDKAAQVGANIIKLQTYTPDTMTLDLKNNDFKIRDKKSLWYNRTLFELYTRGHTPWKWHEKIIKKAKKKKIQCISTPFDESSVDFLEKLKVPAYKIASFENTNIPLITKVAKTKKPIIISTGMATISELHESINLIRKHDNNKIILLKCTSTYPASPKDSNVLTIPHMKKLFNCHVGLSDHTLGIGAAIAAVSHGAKIIEKHFTLNREDGGIDSAFSLEPHEMKMLIKESKVAWESIGKTQYGPTVSERKSLQFRRSLYVSKNVKKGEIIDKNNVKNIRPGNGIPPKYLPVVLGKKFSKNIKIGTPLNWRLIK